MKISYRFASDTSGNFAIITAIMSLPLVFGIGAAVDLSRAYSARSSLQDAIDAAALAVVKDSGFDQTKANEIAQRMLLANHDGEFANLEVELTSFGAIVTADTKVPTTLTALLGYGNLNSSVTSTVQYPPTKYEIALVLDTTGSMAGNKLAEMKQAATSMVDALTETEIMRRRVSFAVVPFSNYVNVGPDKANAGWIDKSGLLHLPYSIIPAGIDRLRRFEEVFGQKWKGCIETRIEKDDETFSVDDTTPTIAKPRTLFVPAFAPDEPAGGSFVNDYLDAEVTPEMLSAMIPLPKYPFVENISTSASRGPHRGCETRPITALTKDYALVKREIGLLKAVGNTNITEGVAWGMRVLSPNEPFTEGLPVDQDVQKIMVLLTDGDNTLEQRNNSLQSAYSSYGYIADGRWDGSYKSRADAYQACPPRQTDCHSSVPPAPSAAKVTKMMDLQTSAACENTKKGEIEIYTIRLEVDSKSSSKLLTDCATDKSHYYDAPTASKLQEIFDDIANRIKKLQITS